MKLTDIPDDHEPPDGAFACTEEFYAQLQRGSRADAGQRSLIVRFLLTVRDGQKEIGRITYRPGGFPLITGDIQRFVDDLFSRYPDVETAMRNAPVMFDGSFVRAELIEE